MDTRIASPADIPGIVRLIQQLAVHDYVPPPDGKTSASVLSILLSRPTTMYVVADIAVDPSGRLGKARSQLGGEQSTHGFRIRLP